MSAAPISRWRDGALEPLDYCDFTDSTIAAADSWFVTGGTALALAEHRARFLTAVPGDPDQAARFWDAAITAIPAEGDWFPRVEAHDAGGATAFLFRLRAAPQRHRAAVLATWRGADPRTVPAVKGPDLQSLLRIRTAVQGKGADDAVLLTPDGFVVDGATSALLWWRGDILCGPPATPVAEPVEASDRSTSSGHIDRPSDRDTPLDPFARVDSVTSRSILTLARALGHDTHEEAVTPAELDGTEVWAVNALHGIRIVTVWIDGPRTAERPGRLGSWRARLDALRKPIR